MDKRINAMRQVCSADRVTLNGGKGNGLNLIYCSVGEMDFILNESKCLDVASLKYKGKNVSFISKNGFTNDGSDFLRDFGGGMLYTCGLDAIGGVEGHPLHGRIHNVPAENVTVSCTEECLTVSGEIRDCALFGGNMLLKRTVTAYACGKLEVSDEIVNEGYADGEYCLLYHVNFGYPFLTEKTYIETDAKEIIPRSEKAAAHVADCLKFCAPSDNEEEECFFHEDATAITVHNGCGLTAKVNYSGDMFGFVEWKSFASGDYALGIEPATSALDSYLKYKTVKPGETKKHGFAIEFKEN